MLTTHESVATTTTDEYFRILQLPKTATVIDVNNAFRKKALLCHPDRSYATPELKEAAAEQFKFLNAAKDALIKHIDLWQTDPDRIRRVAKSLSIISNSTREFVKEQLKNLVNSGANFDLALREAKLVTNNSLVNIVANSTHNTPFALTVSMRRCRRAFEKAASFNIEEFPEVLDLICIHQEASKVNLEWLTKLSHLSTDSLVNLVDAINNAGFPVKETCLFYADIKDDRVFEFTAAIGHLTEAKLSNLDNIDSLYQAGNKAQELANAFIGLDSIKKLTPTNRATLLKHLDYSQDIGRGLEMIGKSIEAWKSRIEYYGHNIPLEEMFLSQDFFDRLVKAIPDSDGICYAVAEFISLQAKADKELLIKPEVINHFFEISKFLKMGSLSILKKYGVKDVFFSLRCLHFTNYNYVLDTLQYAHLSTVISDNLPSGIDYGKKEDWDHVITKVKRIASKDPVLYSPKTFLDMLNQPFEDGSTLSTKLQHIKMCFIMFLAIECAEAQLSIPKSLFLASELCEKNFMNLITQLRELRTSTSETDSRLFKSPSERFFTKNVEAEFIDLVNQLKTEDNVIEKKKDNDCVIC